MAKVSKSGYKKNSKDKNEPFLRIPSGMITMREDDGTPLKKGPILGIDNFGNQQLMLPGMDYQFPGNSVYEIPMAKNGGTKKVKINSLPKAQAGGEEQPQYETVNVTDINDPAYQDYLRLQYLYDWSNVKDFDQRDRLKAPEYFNKDLPYSEHYSYPKKYRDLTTTYDDGQPGLFATPWNAEDGYTNYQSDDLGVYGSKASRYNFTTKEELDAWIRRNRSLNPGIYEHSSSPLVVNDTNIWNQLMTKYQPIGYDAMIDWYDPQYGYNFATDYDNNKKRFIYKKPKTAFLEDGINRNTLRSIFPKLTDEEIDKHVASTRANPDYITNKLKPNESEIWINDTGLPNNEDPNKIFPKTVKQAIYEDPVDKVNTNLAPEGAIGYLGDEIVELTQMKKARYLPRFGSPESYLGKRYVYGAPPKPPVADITRRRYPIKSTGDAAIDAMNLKLFGDQGTLTDNGFIPLDDPKYHPYNGIGPVEPRTPEKEMRRIKTPKFNDGGNLPKAQDGKNILYVNSKKDPAYKAYSDSSNLYKAMVMQDRLMGSNTTNNPYINARRAGNNKPSLSDFTVKSLKEGRVPKLVPGLENLGPIASDFDNAAELKEFANSIGSRNDIRLVDYYKSLGFNDNNIMYHTSADVVHPKIKPVDTYWDGSAWSPVYKKPRREVIIQKVPDKVPVINTPSQLVSQPENIKMPFKADLTRRQYPIALTGDAALDRLNQQLYGNFGTLTDDGYIPIDDPKYNPYIGGFGPRIPQQEMRRIAIPPGGFKDGGQLPKAQAGVNVRGRANFQDSLDVANSAQQVIDWYRSQGYYGGSEVGDKLLVGPRKGVKMISMDKAKAAGNKPDPSVDRAPLIIGGRTTFGQRDDLGNGGFTIELPEFEVDLPSVSNLGELGSMALAGTLNAIGGIQNLTNESLAELEPPYRYRQYADNHKKVINTDAPKALYDARIDPRSTFSLRGTAPGYFSGNADIVDMPMYEKFYTAPWSILSDADKRKRLEFGILDGTPYKDFNDEKLIRDYPDIAIAQGGRRQYDDKTIKNAAASGYAPTQEGAAQYEKNKWAKNPRVYDTQTIANAVKSGYPATQSGAAEYELNNWQKKQSSKNSIARKEPNPNTDIAHYMKTVLGLDKKQTSYAERKKLAEKYGIQNYNGSAKQNIELLNKIKSEEDPADAVRRMLVGEKSNTVLPTDSQPEDFKVPYKGDPNRRAYPITLSGDAAIDKMRQELFGNLGKFTDNGKIPLDDPKYNPYLGGVGPRTPEQEMKRIAIPPGGFQQGGQLPKKKKKDPIFTSDPNNIRLKQYSDSLDVYNLSNQIERIYPNLPQISKDKFDEIEEKEGNLTEWQIDEVKYKEDKKKKKKDINLEDYIYSTKRKDYEDPRRVANMEEFNSKYNDDWGAIEKFIITLPNGNMKIPGSLWEGKPDWEYYAVVDGKTGTARSYSTYAGKTSLLNIYPQNIEPIETRYYGKDIPVESGSVQFNSREFINNKLTKKQQEQWQNYIYESESKDFYEKPTQPVIYKKGYKGLDPSVATLQPPAKSEPAVIPYKGDNTRREFPIKLTGDEALDRLNQQLYGKFGSLTDSGYIPTDDSKYYPYRGIGPGTPEMRKSYLKFEQGGSVKRVKIQSLPKAQDGPPDWRDMLDYRNAAPPAKQNLVGDVRKVARPTAVAESTNVPTQKLPDNYRELQQQKIAQDAYDALPEAMKRRDTVSANNTSSTQKAINQAYYALSNPVEAAGNAMKYGYLPQGNMGNYGLRQDGDAFSDTFNSFVNPFAWGNAAYRFANDVTDKDSWTTGLGAVNMGADFAEALPFFGAAAKTMAPAVKSFASHPLVNGLHQVAANKQLYGPLYTEALLSKVANSLTSPFGVPLYKLPGISKAYKNAAYSVGRQSGMQSRSLKQIKDAVFGKGPGGSYTGGGYGDKNQQLLRQYIYEDAPYFEQSSTPQIGLEEYVKQYGPLDNFKLKMSIPEGRSLTINDVTPGKVLSGPTAGVGWKSMNPSLAFLDELDDPLSIQKAFADEVRKKGTVALSRNNPGVYTDSDIGGHNLFVTHDPVTDQFSSHIQDIWKFTPKDYAKRYTLVGEPEGRLAKTKDLNQYKIYQQAKLMEKAGKPFVLHDVRPFEMFPTINGKPAAAPGILHLADDADSDAFTKGFKAMYNTKELGGGVKRVKIKTLPNNWKSQ